MCAMLSVREWLHCSQAVVPGHSLHLHVPGRQLRPLDLRGRPWWGVQGREREEVWWCNPAWVYLLGGVAGAAGEACQGERQRWVKKPTEEPAVVRTLRNTTWPGRFKILLSKEPCTLPRHKELRVLAEPPFPPPMPGSFDRLPPPELGFTKTSLISFSYVRGIPS